MILTIIGFILTVGFIIMVFINSCKVDNLEKEVKNIRDNLRYGFGRLENRKADISSAVRIKEDVVNIIRPLLKENKYIGEVYELYNPHIIWRKWRKFTEEDLEDKHLSPCDKYKINGEWIDGEFVILYKDYLPYKEVKEKITNNWVDRVQGRNKNETNKDTRRSKRGNKSARRSNKG